MIKINCSFFKGLLFPQNVNRLDFLVLISISLHIMVNCYKGSSAYDMLQLPHCLFDMANSRPYITLLLLTEDLKMKISIMGHTQTT